LAIPHGIGSFPSLLQKLSTPSDYSVSDFMYPSDGIKKEFLRQGVLMGVNGWKRLPWRLSEK
jgi:hypothetical protein